MYIQTELNLIDLEKNDLKIENRLIINNEEGNFLLEIKKSLETCINFYFSVAFINFSGLQLILEDLKKASERGVKGKVLTSTYLNFTEVSALKKLREFKNINLNIFITEERNRGFHTKAYIFEYEDSFRIYIGSSNLTQGALKSNEEWNVLIVEKKGESFSTNVMESFKRLFDEGINVSDEFIKDYESVQKEMLKLKERENPILEKYDGIKPNSMQKEALINLERLRLHGGERGIVVAATGTGKTYMSAFDVKKFNPKKMLFIVHREDILRKAIKDFKKVMPEIEGGLFTGNVKEREKRYLFSTIQSIASHYESFHKEEFDYIIIDEAHHSPSETYKRVIEYFKPKFLLGMTATPERTEGLDVFKIFHNNLVLEVRLNEALEKELVVPFHYFGITDIDLVDYSGIDISDTKKVSKILKIGERVDFIIEKMNFYGFHGEKRRCIGFCASVDHAKYMEEEFNKRGIKSVALVGTDSINKRKKEIENLEDNNNELEVIFTVDLFNEGVDIPSTNLVLMLRPTESSIIFIQQLGRGLRKHKEKDFLTVLDFIGNYNKAFQIAIALNGKDYNKATLKKAIETDFIKLKGCTNIQMDEIVKDRILEQINKENFNGMKYLREEYNEFKKLNGGKIVNSLVTYTLFEGAINPIKFIRGTSNKTYLHFLEKVEKDFKDKELLRDEKFKLLLRDITGKLPIKRPFEYIILKYLIENKTATKKILKNEIEKKIEFVDEKTLDYTLECLRGDYGSKKESNFNFIEIKGENISLKEELIEIFDNELYSFYIKDCIEYGLLLYEKDFGFKNYGMPFLKLYERYTRDDVVRMSNAKMKFGGYGMGGLKTNGNNFYMFVGMEKEEGTVSAKHENEFIEKDVFVWQSSGSTTLDSDIGRRLVNNKEENINMHLFIRKHREIDKVIEPYVYVGLVDTIYHEGEKPITFHLKLRENLNRKIFNELK